VFQTSAAVINTIRRGLAAPIRICLPRTKSTLVFQHASFPQAPAFGAHVFEMARPFRACFANSGCRDQHYAVGFVLFRWGGPGGLRYRFYGSRLSGLHRFRFAYHEARVFSPSPRLRFARVREGQTFPRMLCKQRRLLTPPQEGHLRAIGIDTSA
jgi:hypothetical protein